jgi:hypothetical protein
LRDLPQQKIPMELCGGGDPVIFLHSHVRKERFFNGTDQENSKTQGGNGQIRKKIYKQEGKNGAKKKKRFFFNYDKLVIARGIFLRNLF